MQASFYNTDTYAIAKQRFNDAWPNLFLEVHHASRKYWHEGRDEKEEDTQMTATIDPAVPVFTLTDETLAGNAIHLFATHFSGEALVLHLGVSVERNETLSYGNDPFILPLNKFTYREYKRRFTERWPNLSIHLYNTKQQYTELGLNLVIKGKKGLCTAINDYTFIFDWRHTLSHIDLSAAIKNNRLGISWDGDMRPLRLKEFEALDKKEDAYQQICYDGKL